MVKQLINAIKIGRNDPCFCGSNKKYKKCCLIKQNLMKEWEQNESVRKIKLFSSISSDQKEKDWFKNVLS